MNNPMLKDGTLLVGRYAINGYLNAGGMQEVYACFDNALDRAVVLKTPKGGVKDRRFRRGAEMGARISHHNVAATLDYYEDEKLTFLIEEYVEGLDLAKRLRDEFEFLDPCLAAHVIHNIARALMEAHRVGICHRDLKPSNIMTSRDAGITSIKLTDFGIAKLAEHQIAAEIEEFEQDESTLTSSNTLLGAVPYMAPECWANWKTAGQPMDVWALGCIAYQLVSGTPPFGTGRAAIAAVVRAENLGQANLTKPAIFGVHASTGPLEDQIWSLIQSCIQVAPAARPSAAEVARICGEWCYAFSERRRGTITSYGVRYSSGAASQTGYIKDDVQADSWFYHRSEYFGNQKPAVGQRVNFSVHAGYPHARAAPVLNTK
ncbi:serine/threonine-protein kinase [Rhodanobacter sp. ANJX3]|uniref:protein kinase domain-containing protein n=1 Tax=Rhodanobacter sp. ANJX3 TaxID=2723083 RepID=UPI0017AE0409|nr:serine/threonine-protein kinase [Rhodanobacter sp. ANJX3]